MATTSSPQPVRAEAFRGTGPFIGCTLALAALALMLFHPAVLNDGDTYWHLAAGGWMTAHRSVLHQDVFSYTWAGRPWQTHEWLSEVAMALTYRAAGWNGLLVLFGLALTGTVLLIAGQAGRWVRPLTLLVMLMFSLGVIAPSLLVRPHLLAAPVLALWCAELLAAREDGRAPRPWMPALMLLWANLHGSYVFGFLLAAPLALEALMEPGADRWKVIRGWGLVGALSLAAIFLTPSGAAGVVYPFKILGMAKLDGIVEWRAADFAQVTPLEIALLGTIFACLWHGVRVPPWRLALLMLVLHMTLQHQRHQLVLSVVAPMLLAEPFGRALGAPSADEKSRWPGIAFVVLGGLLIALRLALPISRSDAINTPAAALAHVPASLAARPVFNTYGFGGYLIFKGVRPFIDGRADMYGDAFFDRQMRIVAGDPAVVDKALAQYGVAWTILAPTEPLVRVLDAKPGWRRLYADKWAVVHVRTP